MPARTIGVDLVSPDPAGGDTRERRKMEDRDLCTVDEDVARDLDSARPTLLHMVSGFVDAGSAGEVVGEHLTGRYGPRRLVTFDIDQLLDYRARRPTMTFDSSSWSHYDEPELVIDLLRDAAGTPFLLMHGAEPDFQWERFAAAVRDVVERFDVPLTVGVNGIPMGVPHTRPLGVTAHGSRRELASGAWTGTIQVPASIGALLEYRLGRWGHDAMGLAVHVPHYLAPSTYPQAAIVALEHLEHATGLELEPQALEAAARDAGREIDRQVAGSQEVAAVVAALEEQYDSFSRALGTTSLLAGTAEIPSADELGAEFERFLAEQARPES
jgi:predicted ATP-grasp superfamily ATP-dependent carboligase